MAEPRGAQRFYAARAIVRRLLCSCGEKAKSQIEVPVATGFSVANFARVSATKVMSHRIIAKFGLVTTRTGLSTFCFERGKRSRMKSATKQIAIKDLHFDLANPRYGRRAAEATSEEKALDMIATDFLVDDLLTSITTNGFFEGEPLIVKPVEDGYTVLEGNRRLAALLILAGDPRAVSQKKRTDLYRAKLAESNTEAPSKVPAVLITDNESATQALAYLGTKHIVGARQWDSYAKARWMAEMRSQTSLSLTQIKEMLGDTGGLVDRMLEGYYLVEQLREAGRFEASQSYIRGRGSNPEFPFSWIYTAVNLAGVRRFVGLGDKREPEAAPIKDAFLTNAGDLLEMMFGNRSRQRPPVIDESRNLGDLSKAMLDPAQAARLREGVRLSVVIEESRPLTEQLSQLLDQSLSRLSRANGLLSRGIEVEQARRLDSPSLQTSRAAATFRKGIRDILSAENEADEE